MFNNLFLDVPVFKKGKVLSELDFFRDISETHLHNPKKVENLFSLLPCKGGKVWIHFYKYGSLTHIGIFNSKTGNIERANLHIVDRVIKVAQLVDIVKTFETFEIIELLRFCNMQLEELEECDVFDLWESDGEREPFTITKIRTALVTKLVGDGSEIEVVNTLTCKQDRLPNAALVVEGESWSDKLYNNLEFMELINSDKKCELIELPEYLEQIELF